MTDNLVYKERTTFRTIAFALVVFIVGAVLLWVSQLLASWPVWAAIVRDLGSLLVATVCLGVLWELAAKRSFLAEVLNATHLSSGIQTTGLIGVQSRWYDDVPWKAMLASADRVDIFLAYGVAWRGVMADELGKFAIRNGSFCRIILPDPADKAVIAAMASNFRRGEEEIIQRVTSAKKEFVERLSAPGTKARFEVWYASRPPLYSFVIMGDSAVVTMYKHQSGQPEVIGFVVRRGGHFFEFLERELAAFVSPESEFAKLVASN